MRPLLFVNWASVNARFTALMWIAAVALGLVVLFHLLNAAPVAPPSGHAGLAGTALHSR